MTRSRAAPGSGVAGSSGRRPPLPSAVTVTRMESATADRRRFYAPEHLARGSQTDVLVSHVDSPETFYVQQMGVHAEVGPAGRRVGPGPRHASGVVGVLLIEYKRVGTVTRCGCLH